jgi:hypothetical protein
VSEAGKEDAMRKPCAILTLAAAAMLAASPIAGAEDHLVSRGAVDARLAEAAAERARNLASLDAALASEGAGKAAASAGIDLKQVRSSLTLLSDSDLRDLSRRAAALSSDPVAGHYGDAEGLVYLMLLVVIVIFLLRAVQ